MYCTTKTAYYICISFEVLSYGTLYKYSLIVYCDLILFPCINLMTYLYILFIKVLFVFYCHDSFFTVPTVIFNDMFSIHFLDFWNNKEMIE